MTFKEVFEKIEIYILFVGIVVPISFFFYEKQCISFSYQGFLLGFSIFLIFLGMYFFLFIRAYYKKKIQKFLIEMETCNNRLRWSQKESREGRHTMVSLILPGYLEAKNIFSDIGKNVLLEKYINESVESCGKLGQIIVSLGAAFEVQEVFLPDIIKLIKQCFSYELLKNGIDIRQFGDGFYTLGTQSQMYYFFYNVFKEIIYKIPKNGQLDIYYEEHENTQLIKIIDDGFFLPDELKRAQSKKEADEIDMLCSLTNEETKNLCGSLGWEIVKERNILKQNITTVKCKKPFLRENNHENIIFLKDNPRFYSHIKTKQ